VSKNNFEAIKKKEKTMLEQYREESTKPMESEIFATIPLKEIVENKSPEMIKRDYFEKSRLFFSDKVDKPESELFMGMSDDEILANSKTFI